MQDALTDRSVIEVVLQKSAQVGGTEVLLNLCGYHIDQDPAPIMVVQPSLELVDEWSRARLAPMLRDTPCLQEKVAAVRSRDSGNRIREKLFRGGRVVMAGANSAKSLRGRPMQVVACDDVDGFEATAEGDPISLARKRATTFGRHKKVFLLSTPTLKDASRIESAFLASDQRYFEVPCPRCGAFQRLRWGGLGAPFGLKWEDDEKPEDAFYRCEHCGGDWSDAERRAAVSWGEWRATKPFRGVAGFHISELYSPWVSLGEIAAGFLKAKDDPAELQVWVNTVLGETWEEQGAPQLDANAIFSRREAYGPDVPREVAVITAAVDVQATWLELYVEGWGRDEESWALEHYVERGDPTQPEVWEKIDAHLLRPRKHASGRQIAVAACCVDTGGKKGVTQRAYDFCAKRGGRRVWAIKGIAGQGRPVWPRKPSRRNKGKVDLYGIGVDSARYDVYKRLQLTESARARCHISLEFDLEFCKQLTAERPITKFRAGYARRIWKKVRARNEAFDLKVYSYAALCGLKAAGVDLNAEVHAAEALDTRSRPGREADADAPEIPTAETIEPIRKKPSRYLRRRSSFWRH